MDKKRNWRAILTWALLAFSILYALPSIVSMPSWYPFKQSVRGGLDLAGGLELRYTVDWKQAVEDATRKVAGNLRDKVIEELAKAANENIGDLSKEKYDAYSKRVDVDVKDIDKAVLTFKDDAAWAAFTALDSPMDRIDNRFELSSSSGDKTASILLPDKVAAEIHSTVVKETRTNLEKRVGGMGLVDPDVRITGDSDIAVQIPGVTKQGEMDVVRAVLGRTAQLTMRFVDRGSAFLASSDVAQKLDAFKKAHPDAVGMELGRSYGAVVKAKNKSDLARFIRDVEVPKDHMIGFHHDDGVKQDGSQGEQFWEAIYLFQKVEITGAQLARARMSYDEHNKLVVLLDFNSEGTRLFADATEKNIGENLAIMLDEDVESAPTIKNKIVGTASITMGTNNLDQAQKEGRALTEVLNQGAYQAPVYKVHDFSVGPSLGADSVNAGALSLLLAFGLIVIFVLLYYRTSGIIASAVLAFNVLLTFVLLVSFGTALTMPGVAGIILTMASAIDGNIITFERIREEIRAGKTPRIAVDIGFSKAFHAIIDGNMTTAITGFVLMNFTSGIIHNFAVTLLIGLATSVFTSVVVSRLLFNWWIGSKKLTTLSI